MSATREALRRRVLEAALVHVPFNGWSARTLARALTDLGLDRAAGLRLFPGGARELLSYFGTEIDRRMIAALADRDLPTLRIRDRIATAVRVRLEILAPYREAVRRAVAHEAFPGNGPRALGGLYRTVDAMWRAAGDTATDFNFYTKRMLLAGVYTSTVLYWIADESDAFEDTWAFLDRRIEDVMRIQKGRARLDCLADRLTPSVLRARRPSPGAQGSRAQGND